MSGMIGQLRNCRTFLRRNRRKKNAQETSTQPTASEASATHVEASEYIHNTTSKACNTSQTAALSSPALRSGRPTSTSSNDRPAISSTSVSASAPSSSSPTPTTISSPPNTSTLTPTTTQPKMSTESSLRQTLSALQTASPTSSQTSTLLKSAKHNLLALNALIPSPNTPPHILSLARATLEASALLSIRAQDADAFTHYHQQLQAFYELLPSAFSTNNTSSKSGGNEESQRSKITGLYLMLLLTKGDYAGFHTVLEGLESSVGAPPPASPASTTSSSSSSTSSTSSSTIAGNKFLSYPVTLEQWLMEGAYDRVWNATSKKHEAPSPEFGVFSEVLIHTIRAEIASCSEKAYASIPVASAKNLLFLESEGAVVEFARGRGWEVGEGKVWFRDGNLAGKAGEEERAAAGGVVEKMGTGGGMVECGMVIENTIGYARELETIV